MKTLHVDVTADDIATGRPRDGQVCPIAVALRRVLHVNYHVTLTRLTHNDGYPDGWSVVLPPEAQAFIAAFDSCNGSPVGPFSFDIDVPED